jgi:hypothetical protein
MMTVQRSSNRRSNSVAAKRISTAATAIAELESRTMFSLLGVSTPAMPYLSTIPEIAMGLQSPIGTPASYITYTPATEDLSVLAASELTISNPAGGRALPILNSSGATGTSGSVTINAIIDGNGNLAPSNSTNTAALSISGSVTVGTTRYSGNLLTASIVAFGFTTTPASVVPTFDFVFAPTGGALDIAGFYGNNEDVGVALTSQSVAGYPGNFGGVFTSSFETAYKGTLGAVTYSAPQTNSFLLYTSPDVTDVDLGGATAAPFTDTATIMGGDNPGGSITFTLVAPNGGTVDTETVAVSNGDGSYTTPAGYILPTTGAITGTYQWNASYSGDINNLPVTDLDNMNEQIVVNAATPALTTTASLTGPLGSSGGTTLSDSAVLAGGYLADGLGSGITFTLDQGSMQVYTTTDSVTGNGTYGASYALPATGAVTGTYTWQASYSGDADNASATDQRGPLEQTVVSPANPTVVSTAAFANSSGNAVGSAVPEDSVVLAGGFDESGTITFNLTAPDGSSADQEIVPVNGNGTYASSNTKVASQVGIYTWTAVYSGDAGNNVGASDQGGAGEQLTTIKASPALTTTASTPTVTLGTGAVTLTDTADLSGGYLEMGTITFKLYGPGSALLDTEMASVSGDGTYSTPTGYTLPTTSTVAGDYEWDASYAGDGNNNSAADQGGTAEQTVVSPASPSIVTAASNAVTLGSNTQTISDSAVVSGGYFETGSLAFCLKLGTTVVYNTTDTLNGNNTYTASYTLPTTATAAGTYSWHVTYVGDGNNSSATDQGGAAEQTIVSPATPSIVTTASSPITLGTAAQTITDSAVVSGGYYETGGLTFVLDLGSTQVSSTTDTLAGNGNYTASYTLPTNSTAAGTYLWHVTYGGDGNNSPAADQGGAAEQTIVSPATPSIVTTASSPITLGTAAQTITDSAVVSGGYYETGGLTFVLDLGSTQVSLTTDTLTGNGNYTASYTLPTNSTAAGTYLWHVTYGGDGNNKSAVDQGGAAEQTIVSPATPSIVTTASSGITLGATAPTISDSAVVSGGYYETGSLAFSLTLGSTTVYSTSDTLNGNNTYTASYTLPTTGSAAGTYTWHVTYGGDGNNKSAADQGGIAEQTIVSPATPSIVTTASSGFTLGATVPTISDSAVVSAGYFETGSLTFVLDLGSTQVSSTTDTLTGNSTYTASYTLPTTGTAAGTYCWHVTYGGDGNNKSAVDQGGAAEQTVVSPATPSISTTPSVTSVTLSGSSVLLKDTAVLSGGYYDTGTITFTLYSPSSVLVDTESVTVTGSGSYSTPSGYTLAATAAAGTYQWDATYSGDKDNILATDNNDTKERVVVTASPITISGTKFLDLTGDGFSCDDPGLGGVTIDLFKETNGAAGLQTGTGGDTLVGSTVTASNGSYSFTSLTAGVTYYVQEVVPTGYIQTGGGPNGSACDSYYTITAQTGQTYASNNFDDFNTTCNTTVCSFYYVIDGCKTVTCLTGNVQPGDEVMACFSASSCSTGEITLVSYTCPDNSFNANDASNQVIFDCASATITGTTCKTYCLTVQIPSCDYQIDLVCGAAIDHFGSATSNVFYHAEGRCLDSANGGTYAPTAGGSTISGIVFDDANMNGTLGTGDFGVAGALLTLTGTVSGKAITPITATTSSNGSYSFSNLAPGTYTVTETSVPPGSVMEQGQATSYTFTLPANVTCFNPMGNEAMVNFAVIGYGNVEGFCWDDANADGQVDWNDVGICGMQVDLTGTNCYGAAVSIQCTTDADGEYLFSNLLPGKYTLLECQPAGYTEEAISCGKVNGAACGTTSGYNEFCGIQLGACGQNGVNYNFGERSTIADCKGAQATPAFWMSAQGQALLCSLNGGSNSTALGNWLASMFSNMYGCAACNFTGMTNAQIASFFINKDFNVNTAKLNTAVLATAFNCYATSSTLAGGTMASSYGFTVSSEGSGYDLINVGSDGAAFGVANNSTISILQALESTDAQALDGLLYNGNSTLQNEAYTTYTTIDSDGGIT